MSSLEHKSSDPWINRDESVQTDGDSPGPTSVIHASLDSGFRSQELMGACAKSGVANLSADRQSLGQLSDPWRRERRVVVAVDGSELADKALDFYLDTLHRMEYLIILVHCSEIHKVPLCDEIPREEWNECLQSHEKSMNVLENDFAAKLRNEGVNFKTRFFYHPKPGSAIIHVAEEEKAAFIVTGSRGLGRMRRTILGSVSDYLVHHSKIPVLVCPPDSNCRHLHTSSTGSKSLEALAELAVIEEKDDIRKIKVNQHILKEPEADISPGLSRRSFKIIDI